MGTRRLLLLFVSVLLLGAQIAHGQDAAKKVVYDGCNTCTYDPSTGIGHCTAIYCGIAPVEKPLPVRAAQPAPPLLAPMLGAYIGLSWVDAGQTGSCLGAGRCVERNPLLRPLSESPTVLVTVKLAANSGVAYAIWKMRRTRPKTALALAITATAVQAVVVGSNARQRR